MRDSAKRAGLLDRGVLVSHTSLPQPSTCNTRLFPVSLSWLGSNLSVGALIDSGADGNFIDHEFATQAGIPLAPLDEPLNARAIDGHKLARISHQTLPVSLAISGNHNETIRFMVLSSPSTPLVLGRPWLEQHNPHITWSDGKIISWGNECYSSCLRSAPSVSKEPSRSSYVPDLSSVPSVYHDLGAVFSKSSAASLPPHRPYDCPIDLLPGSPLPKGRLYNLSGPERETMKKYISDSLSRPPRLLQQGFFLFPRKTAVLGLVSTTVNSTILL